MFLVLLLGAAGFQLYNLYRQKSQLRREAAAAAAEYQKLSNENGVLQADLGYFSNQENLSKDLKSKFDYKRPGERLIIIVPNKP